MGLYTLGLSSIKVGAKAVDGDMGTTLAILGTTLEGSAQLNMADAEATEFFVEEQEAAVKRKTKQGAITLTFSIANPDTTTLVTMFGGTASGTTPNKKWVMPASLPTIELSVEVIPGEGFKKIEIPNGSFNAKLNGQLGRQNLFVIDVVVTALAPNPAKSGVGPIQIYE